MNYIRLVKDTLGIFFGVMYALIAILLISAGLSRPTWYPGALYFLLGVLMLCLVGGLLIQNKNDEGNPT